MHVCVLRGVVVEGEGGAGGGRRSAALNRYQKVATTAATAAAAEETRWNSDEAESAAQLRMFKTRVSRDQRHRGLPRVNVEKSTCWVD